MVNDHHFAAKDDLDNRSFQRGCSKKTLFFLPFPPHYGLKGSFLKSVKSAHVIIMTVGQTV